VTETTPAILNPLAIFGKRVRAVRPSSAVGRLKSTTELSWLGSWGGDCRVVDRDPRPRGDGQQSSIGYEADGSGRTGEQPPITIPGVGVADGHVGGVQRRDQSVVHRTEGEIGDGAGEAERQCRLQRRSSWYAPYPHTAKHCGGSGQKDPSRLKHTALTGTGWARLIGDCCDPISRTRTDPLSRPTASNLSKAKANAVTRAEVDNTRTGSTLAAVNSRTLPSEQPVAIHLPLELIAIRAIPRGWAALVHCGR
jgi:hypothetical protein